MTAIERQFTEAELKLLVMRIRNTPTSDYMWGYYRGVNKNVHGDRWMTPTDHTRLMAKIGSAGDGYRDGYAGRLPPEGVSHYVSVGGER